MAWDGSMGWIYGMDEWMRSDQWIGGSISHDHSLSGVETRMTEESPTHSSDENGWVMAAVEGEAPVAEEGSRHSDVPTPTMFDGITITEEHETPRAHLEPLQPLRPRRKSFTNSFLHVVDDDLSLSDELADFIEGVGIDRRHFDYHIVAILGAQSSGKSTLLNHMFGTCFEVMNAEAGRAQTTRGVWLAKASSAEEVLVMDLEGTDSRERGEEGQCFERYISLFALAVADCLIVNLWCHDGHKDIGRYNAANYGLLKTVFEVNLRLFRSEAGRKTTLVFVIRDHAITPMTALEGMIRDDLNKIWADMNLPEAFADSKVTDFFVLAFTGLPNFDLQRGNFVTEADRLRRRFVDANDPDNFFRSTQQCDVPGDGLAQYITGVWTAIRENRDLDLPTQKEMLANYRCDEIKDQILAAATRELGPSLNAVNRGEITENLGELFSNTLLAALAGYDGDAARYDAQIGERKREELRSMLEDDMSAVFHQQTFNIRREAQSTFAKYLNEIPDDVEDCAQTIKDAKARAREYMENKTAESRLSGVEWSIDVLMREFDSSLEERAVTVRDDILHKQFAAVRMDVQKSVQKAIFPITEKAEENMWKEIRSLLADKASEYSSLVTEKLRGFACSDDELLSFQQQLITAAAKEVEGYVRTVPPLLKTKMRQRFDELFRYDEKRRPRVWGRKHTLAQIDTAFSEARAAALLMADLFSSVCLDEQTITILSEEKCAELMELLKLDMDEAYRGALREHEMAIERAQIPVPWWVWPVIAILGFNEFWAILTSPFLLLIVIVGLAIVIYFVLSLHDHPLLGNAWRFFTAISSSASRTPAVAGSTTRDDHPQEETHSHPRHHDRESSLRARRPTPSENNES